MKTMTTNSNDSKELYSIINRSFKADLNSLLEYPFDFDDDDFYEKASKYAIAEYEYYLFADAIEFHRFNNVYFDNETLLNYKEIFMTYLKHRSSNDKAVLDEVSEHIDAYIANYKIEGETKKIYIIGFSGLYDSCINLILEASKNVKEVDKSINGYRIIFDSKANEMTYEMEDLDEGLDYLDFRHMMFQTILKCYVDGGSFYMIKALDKKLDEDAFSFSDYSAPSTYMA